MRATSSPNELHITIGVYPAKDANLRQDIKLIKAALLYADRVTIYSPSAALLQIATRLGDLSETEFESQQFSASSISIFVKRSICVISKSHMGNGCYVYSDEAWIFVSGSIS